MDGRQFDSLARDLTSSRDRRGVLGGIAGGTLAGVLGGLGLRALTVNEADAKKKKKHKKKKKKCKGSASCGAGQLCVHGKCVTGAGTCPEDVSICHGDTPFTGTCNDNPDCHCYIKVVAGTRCGTKASACGTCTVTEQCASFGVGATCVVPTIDSVDCDCPEGQGFCITPCAS